MNAELLALLEDGPHTAPELAGWLELDVFSVVRALTGLAKQGRVVRLNRGARVVWERMDGELAAAAPAAAKAKKKKEKVAIPVDGAPSWWLGLDRAAFNAALKDQSLRMALSSVSKQMSYQEAYGSPRGKRSLL